ncbi:MAG: preprotein translocase subunit YajC [Alistipes sp.]|nr:preprotein translocase subunit YajC [Alistipes sp.]
MNLITILLQAEPMAPRGGGMNMIVMLVLFLAVFYFFLMRPQQKRQKEMNQFREALTKGQKVITAGGIYGTVKEIKEGYVLLEVDSNTTIRVDKTMIMRVPEAPEAKK